MDTFGPWPIAEKHNPCDASSLEKEIDRLSRPLRLATIAYLDTKKELDDAREALGFYKKPLRFVNFPREVRDQVYRYALRAPMEVNPEPLISSVAMGPQRSPRKPATPGLCRVNKQIRDESLEILYSENIFRFNDPIHLIQFQQRIGERNRDLVRYLHLYCTEYPPRRDSIHVDLSPHEDTPEAWAEGLRKFTLRYITHLKISIESLGPSWASLPMSSDLELAIKFIFSQNQQRNLIPRLMLQGFKDQEFDKFPDLECHNVGFSVRRSSLKTKRKPNWANLNIHRDFAGWE